MIRFPGLTYLNLLIATHDALATTLAALAAFYLRFALRLPLFPLYPRAPSCEDGGCVAGAPDRPRGGCRNSPAWNRKRRGQTDLAGRPVVAIARRSGADDPEYSGARRHRRH